MNMCAVQDRRVGGWSQATEWSAGFTGSLFPCRKTSAHKLDKVEDATVVKNQT